jgi:hypothetical protein
MRNFLYLLLLLVLLLFFIFNFRFVIFGFLFILLFSLFIRFSDFFLRCFLNIEFNGEANEFRMLLDKILDALLLKVFKLIILQMKNNSSSSWNFL